MPPAEPGDVLDRFDRVERWVHQGVAALGVVCILSAAVLYNGSLAVLVGHRPVVELVHVVTGFALPVPLVAGLVSRAFRSDVHLLGRFTRADGQWLRSKRRRWSAVGVGKFNAGQKLNGVLSTGAILVLLGTGTIMSSPGWSPLAWRIGATFVHDWFALALGLLLVGHVAHALRDAEAVRGIRSGRVHRVWAEHEHPGWAAEMAAREPDDGRPPRP